ncbi:MAG: ParB/RepB/Spo0J family partition protein [Thermoproteota archaeon]|nr:ParB/RepB/Spo0J family partition protein [Thermoproteota archaeon]
MRSTVEQESRNMSLEIIINTNITNSNQMKIKNIPVNLIDVANENVRKDDSFGKDDKDKLIKDHLSKFDLLQPVVVRFDNESQRYKLLIGRRRYFALSAKGERNIPAVITQLEGAEAEAASLFENLIRKDLPPLEKARMVKKLVDFTKGGVTAVSAKYGLPKSTVSEWLSILTLPGLLQKKIEKGEITTYEAIRIARKPKRIQEKLIAAANAGMLQEEMSRAGVKRGAPRGLLTIRLVFDPRKKPDKQLWDRIREKADENGLEATDYVRSILLKHVQRKVS